jgi:hypothetical protein
MEGGGEVSDSLTFLCKAGGKRVIDKWGKCGKKSIF